MSEPKSPSKRGRKPAPPGAKLSQLTIRLPPTVRLGLALLARERGISISQAVEFAVSQVLRETPMDGTTIEDVVYRWGPRQMRGKMGDQLSAEALAEEALESESLFVLVMPPHLRTPEENFFVQVMHRLGFVQPDSTTPIPVNGEGAEELLSACKVAFRRGVSVEAVVEQWRELLKERSK